MVKKRTAMIEVRIFVAAVGFLDGKDTEGVADTEDVAGVEDVED